MMYIICALQTLALYQKRHSDTIAEAHTFYTAMAIYVFIVVIGELYIDAAHSDQSSHLRVHHWCTSGVYWTSYEFFVTVFVISIFFLCFFGVQIYYLGLWSCHTLPRHTEDPAKLISCNWQQLCNWQQWPRRRARAGFVGAVVVITLIVLLVGLITNNRDRPSVFLYLAIGNCKSM